MRLPQVIQIALVATGAVMLCGCPSTRPVAQDAALGEQSQRELQTAPTSAPGGATADPGNPAVAASQPPGGLFPPVGPPKQIILFYTGDTLSQVQSRQNGASSEGGLSALAHAITDYQAQIVDYNRTRVENEGGDPTSIRADLSAGLLGEHPYLLLDYGGWERPNDFAGDLYVALYFRYFEDFHYSAVAGRLYHQLNAERWKAYQKLDFPPVLLATGAEPVAGALPCVPLVTREIHGQRWGIAAPALPAAKGDVLAQIKQSLDFAQAQFINGECEFSVLLLAEAPTTVYREQAQTSPFTIIIGADPRTGAKPGFGDMPKQGALLLPTLAPSGRQAAVCHLYFEPEGARPVMYYLVLLDCPEDESQPWPYRRLVAEAVEQHFAEVKARQAK